MKIILADELLYGSEKHIETYGLVAFDGNVYVLCRLPYIDYNDGHAYYSDACRVGDEIEEDGSSPSYKIVWDNPYPWDRWGEALKGNNSVFRFCYKKFCSDKPGDYARFIYSQIVKRKPCQVLPNGRIYPYGKNEEKEE